MLQKKIDEEGEVVSLLHFLPSSNGYFMKNRTMAFFTHTWSSSRPSKVCCCLQCDFVNNGKICSKTEARKNNNKTIFGGHEKKIGTVTTAKWRSFEDVDLSDSWIKKVCGRSDHRWAAAVQLISIVYNVEVVELGWVSGWPARRSFNSCKSTTTRGVSSPVTNCVEY